MTVGLSNQLIIPLTLWGNRAPTHCISSIYLSRDLKILVTGCNDGQLLIWDLIVSDTQHLIPKCMLFGHSYRILCLTNATFNNDDQLLVSSSEDGEMCLWDLSDGKCLESTRLQYVHTNIQTQLLQGSHEVRLVCNGYYSEILIIDPITFEIMLTLTSRVNPDWISAIDIVYPLKPQDNIIGLTISGMVKVWVLTGNETRQSEPVYEQEFKQIRCLNALKLTCCSYNQSTVLIVCTKYWQIYDAYDFSLLCSVDNKVNERWLGGEFISAEIIIVWSDTGKGYLYQLPRNCIPERKEFHEKANKDQLHPFAILSINNDQRLLCPPAVRYYVMPWSTVNKGKQYERLLIRGDSLGRIAIWSITNDMVNCSNENIKFPINYEPNLTQSLNDAWNSMNPTPAGIMDHLNLDGSSQIKVTASVFLPLQGTFIAGREDGSIIIIYAIQTFKLQLFEKFKDYEDWPQYQILLGHSGRITSLLYPHHADCRYAIEHLVSSGVDFSVCLWDLYAGTLLHRFSVHAGEITQLLVPPKDCSPRVLNSICSIASDHSVALLSLKEKKCILLASRHMFPVSTIKWRPIEDFMIVGCVDGSVYVWQMETGLLDRVIQGLLAEDIINACDDHVAPSPSEDRLTNPAIHLFRGIKSRNIAAIKHATARGIRHIAGPQHQQKQDIVDLSIQTRSHPLIIQGLKTNPKDQDVHVLFFDVESLVVNLLAHQYSLLSPDTMESQGLTNTASYQKYLHLSSSPEASHKFSKIFVKVKDSAENAAQKIQAKAESVGFKPGVNVANELFYGIRKAPVNEEPPSSQRGSVTSISKRSNKWPFRECDLTMEISQILLSLLHAWGLDQELDKVCETKLGLLKPIRPICFGMLSKGGHMSLLLPTFFTKFEICKSSDTESIKETQLTEEQERSRKFTSTYHWELSHAITTNHVLSVVSLAKTIMSMNCVTFISENEKRNRFKNLSTDPLVKDQSLKNSLDLEAIAKHQKQAKEGWSLLGVLHCGLLPEFIKSSAFKSPLLDVLAKRWQDKCLEIREAAQNILLCELKRIGPKGRKQLVDDWAPYLSQYEDHILPQNQVSQPQNQHNNYNQHHSNTQTQNETDANQDEYHNSEDEDIDCEEKEKEDNDSSRSNSKSSTAAEYRKKTSTAIILLGVIGSVYGQGIEVNSNVKKSDHTTRKTSVIEGFGAGNYTIARRTAHALLHLLLGPPSKALPKHNYLRRAAIDLIGRGFVVWEPYLDITKVLLALLEICCDSDSLIPTLSFGLPLTPASDSCRTARYAISQIASSRSEKFITTLNQEVARFNTLQQNAQSVNVSLACTVLNRSKPEILRNIQLLIEKKQSEISDLIIETMDILLHCLDLNHLKNKGLNQVFPPISKFPFVSSCAATRRIAVGAKNGNLAIYELRTPKQIINAHTGPITCCSFSSDGRHLVTYCKQQAQLCFWSTATSLFGLGNSQTKCMKTYNTPLVPENAVKSPELIWAANKVVLLIFPDGKQHQYVV